MSTTSAKGYPSVAGWELTAALIIIIKNRQQPKIKQCRETLRQPTIQSLLWMEVDKWTNLTTNSIIMGRRRRYHFAHGMIKVCFYFMRRIHLDCALCVIDWTWIVEESWETVRVLAVYFVFVLLNFECSSLIHIVSIRLCHRRHSILGMSVKRFSLVCEVRKYINWICLLSPTPVIHIFTEILMRGSVYRRCELLVIKFRDQTRFSTSTECGVMEHYGRVRSNEVSFLLVELSDPRTIGIGIPTIQRCKIPNSHCHNLVVLRGTLYRYPIVTTFFRICQYSRYSLHSR